MVLGYRENRVVTKTVQLNEGNFDGILQRHSMAIIDFWTLDCQPCKVTAPIVEELAEKYEGRVVVGTVRTDENPEIMRRFDVRAVPTLLVLKDGCEVDRIVLQIADIVQLMRDYVSEKLEKHGNSV